MIAQSRAALYSPQLLALAVELADYPYEPGARCHGEARSRTCGSEVRISCDMDNGGALTSLGLRVSACAVGQAAAAIFARSAEGRSSNELRETEEALRKWLAGEAGEPDWPGIAAIEPALAHAGRHSAILLAWQAARHALCKQGAGG